MYVKGSASVNGNGLFVPKAAWLHDTTLVLPENTKLITLMTSRILVNQYLTGQRCVAHSTQICAIVAPIEMHFIHGVDSLKLFQWVTECMGVVLGRWLGWPKKYKTTYRIAASVAGIILQVTRQVRLSAKTQKLWFFQNRMRSNSKFVLSHNLFCHICLLTKSQVPQLALSLIPYHPYHPLRGGGVLFILCMISLSAKDNDRQAALLR